jgi:hypothetical protein
VSLWKLVAADLLLGAVAFFGLVLVTAPDRLTTTQRVIAWSLFALLVILAFTLVVASVVGARRLMRMRRRNGRSR